MGRTSKLTPELTDRICKALRLGMTQKLACSYANLGHTTFYRWLQEAEREPGAKRDFRDSVKRAEAEGAAKHLVTIAEAANDGSWQAAAWMLERRHGYRRNESQTDAMDEMRATPTFIDPYSDDGRLKAAQMLNDIPIEILSTIDPRRLVAAMQFANEEGET